MKLHYNYLIKILIVTLTPEVLHAPPQNMSNTSSSHANDRNMDRFRDDLARAITLSRAITCYSLLALVIYWSQIVWTWKHVDRTTVLVVCLSIY
jgi:hypothetical protein